MENAPQLNALNQKLRFMIGDLIVNNMVQQIKIEELEALAQRQARKTASAQSVDSKQNC